MEELTTLLNKSSQELHFRMQFAEKFPLEENYSNALEQFPSWYSFVESLSAGRFYPDGNSHPDVDDLLGSACGSGVGFDTRPSGVLTVNS